MARRFGSTPFSDLLANSLAQDDTTLAIAESLDGVLFKSARALPELLIYARLAEAPISQLLPPMQRLAELAGGLSPIPEPLLDLLAWQFHVDGYEAAVTYEDKRRLVDRSILMHRRKGTPWAVAEALRSLGYADARIFEGGGICRYNGEINYGGAETYAAGNRWALFDVEIDLGDNMGVSAASVLRLRVAIEAWKNARSHLRAIRWKASISDSLDFDELLEILTVHATFRDIRPWGFPCYDGSINYDNGIFRNYDGRLNYDGSFPHYFWAAGRYRYDNLIDPLKFSAGLRLSDLVRPGLLYDGFMPHNGNACYGHCDAPALDAFASSVALLPATEFVPVAEEVRTAVRPHILDKPFLCHDGSISYGPHSYNGAFSYDASRNYDSGIFLRHDGRIFYDGSRAHDKWLRDCPLYNSYHDAGDYAARLSLNDSVRKQPDHSGEIAFDGLTNHSPLALPATDPYSATIAPRLEDRIEAEEEIKAAASVAISDETDNRHYDGSICYGQRRIRIYDGGICHDGKSVSGPFGGASQWKRVFYAKMHHYDGGCDYACGLAAPVYYYHSLSDAIACRTSLGFTDFSDFTPQDTLETQCSPCLAESFRMEGELEAKASYSAEDEIGCNYDGSISYGQKRVSVHSGSISYDGSRVSGFTGGMAKFRQRLFDASLNYDGQPAYSLWPDSLYSHRGFSDSCHSDLQTSITDSFGLADGLTLSVKRVVFQNGHATFNASKNYCREEII